MARISREDTRLDSPKGLRNNFVPRFERRDRFGRFTEWIARNMGTPTFLLGLSLFCAVWIGYNVLAPKEFRFDSAALGFTALRMTATACRSNRTVSGPNATSTTPSTSPGRSCRFAWP
jgi:uncharacterized membrane protein